MRFMRLLCRPVWLLILWLATGLVAADSASEFNIRWMSEQYPPYNYTDETGAARGVAVELLAAMYRRLGRAQAEVEFLPWARAYTLLQRQPQTGLFSMTYTAERLALFRFVGPIIATRVVVLAPRTAQLKIADVADLNRLRIGVIRTDIGEQLLSDLGVNDQQITYSNRAENLIQLLHRGRVEAIAYSDDVAFWNMRKVGIDPSQYESVYTLLEGKLGFAFHRQLPDDQLRSLRQALAAVKSSGELDQIARKYLGVAEH